MSMILLPAVRGTIFATLRCSPLAVAGRSLHVSSALRIRKPPPPNRFEEYPNSYVEFGIATPTNGYRRVEPPDWDGSAYVDKSGWFHEWLAGNYKMDKSGQHHCSHYPQSVREYREYEELINEMRDRFFGSYPPKGLDDDYYCRLFDHCIKYDNEVVLTDHWNFYEQNHIKLGGRYYEFKTKVDEYMSIKRQERWDAW